MEENLQNENREEHTSKFIKWTWWRPLYYVYFAGMVVAVVFLYTAQEHGRGNTVTGAPVAVTQPKPAVQQSQQSHEAGKSSQPAELAAATNETSQTSSESGASGSHPEKSEQPAGGKQRSAVSKASASGVSSSKYAFVMSPSEETIEKGKSLFMDDCVACHGANGEGDGPAAAALNPKPRDFHSAKGWINGRMASGMFKTLTHGIKGSAMPPFNTISVKDRLDIISYIRTFKGFPKETRADIRLLTKMIKTSGGSAQGND